MRKLFKYRYEMISKIYNSGKKGIEQIHSILVFSLKIKEGEVVAISSGKENWKRDRKETSFYALLF